MKKLQEFLLEVAKSIGLFEPVENEPLVFMVPSEEGQESKPLVSPNGYGFLIPSKVTLKKLIELDKDNKPILKYLPFNPLQEDALKANTETLLSVKQRVNAMLASSILEIGVLLIQLLEKDETVKNKGVALERFLMNCNEGESRNVRKLVDNDTISKWYKLCLKNKKEGFKPIIEISSVRNKNIDGKTYLRVSTFYFPLFEALHKCYNERDKDHTVNGVKLRTKDVVVFTCIFKAITSGLELDEKLFTFQTKSNSKVASGFESLFVGYLQIMENIIKLSKKILNLDAGYLTVLNNLAIDIASDEVEDAIKEVEKYLAIVPTERSLLTGEVVEVEEPVVHKPSSINKQEVYESFNRQNDVIQGTPYRGSMETRKYQEQPYQEQAAQDANEKAYNMFGAVAQGYPVSAAGIGYGNQPSLQSAISAVSAGINGMPVYPNMMPSPYPAPMNMPMPNMGMPMQPMQPMNMPMGNMQTVNSNIPLAQQVNPGFMFGQPQQQPQPTTGPGFPASRFNMYR